jgi:hypothetical protein
MEKRAQRPGLKRGARIIAEFAQELIRSYLDIRHGTKRGQKELGRTIIVLNSERKRRVPGAKRGLAHPSGLIGTGMQFAPL